MISDNQGWKMYLRALRHNKRLIKAGKQPASDFADLRTHNGKKLEPRWRLSWF